jgi:hypothetical protein
MEIKLVVQINFSMKSCDLEYSVHLKFNTNIKKHTFNIIIIEENR